MVRARHPSWASTPIPTEEKGQKLRIRAETFADHYSQARQFYLSQTETEQNHIAAAFTFELSKVEAPAIRVRMLSHLLNVDEGLAKRVAEGLRLREMPEPAQPARAVIKTLKPSPALSILRNGPKSFRGRKVGALISDGVDADLLRALRAAISKEGARLTLVAPMVGGVKASDGSWIEADEKIDGGPSVLFDAVALLVSEEGAALMAEEASVRDFVADAFAHRKFIAHVAAAAPLLERAAVAPSGDDGVIELKAAEDAAAFIRACRKLRVWSREGKPTRKAH